MYKSLNSKQRDVMITCLLLANHEGKEWEWKGRIHKCMPGQFITSLKSLQESCAKDVTIQNIRCALNKLEKWGFLTNESTKTGRLITIVNWGKYQGKEEETNKAITKETAKNQQRTNKQLTTNKNNKEYNNINNIYIVPKSDEIEKIYSQLPDNIKRLFIRYIELYRNKNKSGKITDNRHLNLLEELYLIFLEMRFTFNGEVYELTPAIFESGIKTILEKEIANLNYAKQVWISEIKKKPKIVNLPERHYTYAEERYR